MVSSSAPRISIRLLRKIDQLDDGSASIAEICRAVGVTAERLGLRRPSYEQVRTHVHAARCRRRSHQSNAELAVDVAFRAKPVTAVLDRLAGTG
jgi:hypothetical protein